MGLKSEYNDKIYFYDDIVDKLVEWGHDKKLVVNFLHYLSNEILEGIRDPEIVDIRIINFGSFYLPLGNALSEVLKYESFLKYSERENIPNLTKINKRELDFANRKYKSALKQAIKLRKKTKKSKLNKKKIKDKFILNG